MDQIISNHIKIWISSKLIVVQGGYREGLSKGKEESLQSGFNDGFKLGSTKGFALSKLLGVIT